MEAKGSVATPSKNGKWEVTFNFEVKKVAVDEEGVVTDLAVDDFIDLAVYANSPEGDLGELLYLKRHKITSGVKSVTIEVAKKPDLLAIDPNHLLIDREPLNNFEKL